MVVAALILPVFSGIGFACAAVLGWRGLRIRHGRDDHQGVSICAAFLLLWMACASLALVDLVDAVGRLEAGRAYSVSRSPRPSRPVRADEVRI